MKPLTAQYKFKDRPHSSTTVAFEEIPLGSGGSVPGFCRATSRQCLACAHKTRSLPRLPATAPATIAPPVDRDPDPIGTVPLEKYPGLREEVLESPVFRGSGGERGVERVKMDKPEPAVRETLEDRDPNNLNPHVQIVWDDVIGEPEGARSPECAWRLSAYCFQHARDWCYTGLAVLAAPPCALAMGCCFACLAFEQIWCVAPCTRCLKIYLASVRTIVQACMSACVVPVAEAVGHLCRHIRVNFRKDSPEEKDMLIV
ncbi:unnamed protein product [Plutella xylostella]|uniref:(diamondback moth) hypothetical protein n=1 Tax=Plutella xylostella TaxID=51655 RepID=A0A8S4FZE4_PLUXY|nr:unnamed protein product [Plutella xylostella]